MKSNILLKPLMILVLFKLALIPSITCAQVATTKAKSLKENIVRIEASFQSSSFPLVDGFGFIIGEKDSIFIVTARHNLRVEDSEQGLELLPIAIKIYFENGTSVPGVYKYSWKNDDVALITAPISNKNPKWNKYCISKNQVIKGVAATFLGKEKLWLTPDEEGKIDSISQTRQEIGFQMEKPISRGTSGTPLIGSDGILGMILSADQGVTKNAGTAVLISRIEILIKEFKSGYYILEPDARGMRSIPGGTFTMGNKYAADNAQFEHEVKIRPFYVMPYEVSFEEYDAFCNTKKRKEPNDQGWGRGNKPVINVTWFDAIEYCNWRSEKDNLQKAYDIGDNGIIGLNGDKNGYRLPTEAEWEYLVKIGSVEQGSVTYETPKDVNYKTKAKKSSRTWAVSDGNRNNFGVYNLRGNVAEWCWDNYDYAYYKDSPIENPLGPQTGRAKIVRGGSWNSDKYGVRIDARDSKLPNFGYPTVGFRLVRNAE